MRSRRLAAGFGGVLVLLACACSGDGESPDPGQAPDIEVPVDSVVDVAEVPGTDVADLAETPQADATPDTPQADIGEVTEVPLADSVAEVPLADSVAELPASDTAAEAGEVPLADVPLADVPLADVPLADVPETDVPVPVVAKVDLLLVVDDSPSMCQEQQALARLFQTLETTMGTVDLRVAVTTTNVCDKGKPGAIRGRFVYQPATVLPPACVEKRVVPCLTDAACQARTDLPDAANWVCEGTQANQQWTCDTTAEVKQATGTDDKFEGDYLFTVASQCRYRCDKAADTCATVFGEATSRCMYPGDDSTRAGCIVPPATAACPPDGPTVLDSAAVDKWLKAWKDGTWAGEASWTGLADAEVRNLVRARLFACMATVGAQQSICANQEQGLLAAWMALDPAGENAAQAQAFVRPDAVLAVLVVSDEDDCSSAASVAAEDFGRCACLADTAGCTPGGTCGLAPGPLMPVSDLVTHLKSLKSDASKLVFAAVAGDVVTGSTTTPGTDAATARDRFFECKCALNAPMTAPRTYACMSPSGMADLGARYQAMAAAMGGSGVLANLCDADGIQAGLTAAAQAIRAAAGR